jgi:DNA-binding transcriptional MocR family regulator
MMDLAAEIDDRSARGIAAAIGRAIRGGRLESGDRLPTVRELAGQLGTSPTTVSEAWNILARTGVIDARGRQGTFVRDLHRPRGGARYRSVTSRPSRYMIDLSTGVPDPDLLPDPRRALERVSRRNLTTSYLDDPILPALEELLRGRWPFEPELLTVVDGAMDAIDRVVAAVARLGDRIAVEDPGFPPLLDLLEQLGVEAIGVAVDEEGMTPESLSAALTQRPVAVILQPRAHNPTGASMTAARVRRLATLLKSVDTIVIEDDHSGDIAVASDVSIGEHLPEQCVHIRSFSKSHGPDLRLAAIGGPGAIVNQVVERRLLGPGWSSRLLQAVLLEMLRDTQTIETVAAARTTYQERRDALVSRLHDRGMPVVCADGINLWLPVDDERAALLTLAARGIGVAPGTPFQVQEKAPAHLRVTVGLVSDEVDRVADALAEAVHGFTPSFRR